MRRFFRTLCAFVVIALLTPVTSAGVLLMTYLFLPLPANLPEPPDIRLSQTSRVFDADGNQIGTFKQFETSIPVKSEDIPTVVKLAVVAAEDRNFYEHGGVDLRGTVRALWADLRNRAFEQGGSTITQQLIKNTREKGPRTIARKVQEAIEASQLDRSIDKDEILFQYLSVIYLGEGAYGVGAASETYFRKSIKEVNLGEAALLAAVIPAPSRYSPRVNPQLAEKRRLHVLKVMLGEGMITREAYDKARYRKVWLTSQGKPPGPATIIYPPESQQSTEPYFTDYVMRYLEAHLPGGRDAVLTGGLRIETTLDPAMQQAAKEQVFGFLDGTEPDLQMSLVSVEPPTGFVRAFIGGRDFNRSQVNFALGRAGGGSGRQPGSSFKPFVLAEALRQGVSPDRSYSGSNHTIGNYTAHNYGGSQYGTVTLRYGTWKSINTVYTRLILDVGVRETMAMARRLGLRSVPRYNARNHGVSVALGALDVAPLDMASAYGVFANRGVQQEPTPVLRVYDRDGKLLLDNSRRKGERELKEEVADNLTAILQGVLSSGTAAGRGIDRPAAGKTGTTQDNKDSWFIGYTPTLSTAVWLGYENKPGTPTKYLRNIKGVGAVTGGTHPARVWQAFMKQALKDVPVTDFNEPAPIRSIADEQKRRARGFFDPGPRQYPSGPPGGGYVQGLQPPPGVEPKSTTTSTEPATTTSTPDSTSSTGIVIN